MDLRTLRWTPLFACLLFIPVAAAAQDSRGPMPADSALLKVLASVHPHRTMIRVDVRGGGAVQGLSAGVRHDALLVWPAPKRRVPLEMIEGLHARRSSTGRNTVGGAVVGALFGGLVLHNLGGTEQTRIGSYATGAALGAFTGFGLSLGTGPWERIYIRADPPSE